MAALTAWAHVTCVSSKLEGPRYGAAGEVMRMVQGSSDELVLLWV